uniref:Uncharacterized protein n=1 Tax=Romanomermis culicivorax TaxID=13658 RepID=A0A915I3P6_ROMCU
MICENIQNEELVMEEPNYFYKISGPYYKSEKATCTCEYRVGPMLNPARMKTKSEVQSLRQSHSRNKFTCLNIIFHIIIEIQ